jgi:cytochrome P450
MATKDIVATARLLLIAGHETTVNLIANGILTLLRHPHVLDRLRRDPDLAIPLTEELLRYEPPVQLLPGFNVALDDIEVAGTTIPKGAPITLVLAAANRDADRFPDPDRFDPDREDNQHLGFLTGIHYCFGAPLARQEVQVALSELARRLENPRLLEDPPPYRQNPTLRGPRHLPIEIDGVW